MLKGLLGGQYLDEARREHVEIIGLGNVQVQGGGIELGEDIYLFKVGVDAV
jgi:hypothetical protein